MPLTLFAARSPRPPASLLPSLLCALLLAACAEPAERPVVFGFAGPVQTDYGAAVLQGAELARAEINAQGGIDGRPLQLRVLDDRADPGEAIAVADALLRDPDVLAVAGHVNSATTSAAAPVYEQGLPAVATTATAADISTLGDWIFRVASSDSANAGALATVAGGLAPRAAVLYENDDYGRGLASAFRAAYTADGGVVVGFDPYLSGTEDLTPYLERIRRRGADLVFVAGLEQGAARIVRQARAVGLDARVLGGDGVEGLVDMGAEFDGTLVGLLYHPDSSPEARRFAERFRAEYGREPGSYSALGYDAVWVLARAARAAGADRDAIRDALARLGRADGLPPYAGATGTIAFDEHGDPAGKEYVVGVIRDGAIRLERDS